jgi:hypothetical protein
MEKVYSNLTDYNKDREKIKHIISSIIVKHGEQETNQKYIYSLENSILIEDSYYVKTLILYTRGGLYFANKRYKNLPLLAVYEVYLKIIKKLDLSENDLKKFEMESKLREK